jgi:hypothetical protein
VNAFPYRHDFSSERVGRSVPFTKQESQTLVPSFSVKSTRRLASISAPHFPQRSSFGSAISISLLY